MDSPSASLRPGSPRLRRRSAEHRTAEDWLAVLAPPVYRRLAATTWDVVVRLPPSPRLRRKLLERSCLRTFNAFNRRDLRVFLSQFDPDVVYDVSHVRDWPDDQVYRGHDGLLDMAMNWYTHLNFWFELLELHDLGGATVLVVGEFQLEGAESGVPLDHVPWIQVATARRGRGLRIDNDSEREEALRAVGVERSPDTAGFKNGT
jgi:ketosteroid isomerase-like protein